ncbi:MAG: GspH/FimT family pseudopilin [Magnetococcales bacterium]|nr:GspH/FimT family pseudopilin [Magnetococcales bacterium]
MKRQTSPSSQGGFTLVELIMGVAIVAILVTVAVPSYNEMLKLNRHRVQTSTLVRDLGMARSEAATRKARVVVCRKDLGTQCSVDASLDWENGWLVFIDADLDDDYGAGDTLISQMDALEGTSNTLRADNTDFDDLFYYEPDGTAVSTTGTRGVTFNFCDDRGASSGMTVEISQSGRPKIGSGTPSGCP